MAQKDYKIELDKNEIEDIIRKKEYLPKEYMSTEEFTQKFGAEELKKYAGKTLLYMLFGTKEQYNNGSLTYTLEYEKKIEEYYGKLVGWANMRIVNYWVPSKEKQNEGATASWRKQKETIDEGEAIKLAESIRDKFLQVIEKIDDETSAIEIGKLLDDGNIDDVKISNQAWVKKYFTVLYPDKFMPMINGVWTNRLFVPLGLKVTNNWYENAFEFAKKAKEYNIDPIKFYHAVRIAAINKIKKELEEEEIDINKLGDINNILSSTQEDFKAIKDQKYITDKTTEQQFEEYLTRKYHWEQKVKTKSINKEETLIEDSSKTYSQTNESVEEPWQKLEIEKKDENGNIIKQYTLAHNRIVFGAPGTGKSHTLEKQTNFLKGSGQLKEVTRVTFHPDYSYAHFVGCYKPYMDGENIKYDFIAGPFLEVYKKARNNPTKNYVLIIEEINRANVAAVFGDVFQLLDRDENGKSEYPITASQDVKKWLTINGVGEVDTLSIPKNMYIWATMNSADQGVYPMDTAFKRRWTFEYMDIDGDGDKEYESFKVTIGSAQYNWKDLRKAINDTLLDANINEDKCLGPYFIKGNTDNKEFASKVLMYLFEDVVKQKPSKIFNEKLKGFSKIYSKSTTDGTLEDIFVNNIITKYTDKGTK